MAEREAIIAELARAQTDYLARESSQPSSRLDLR
jgi:hypothetical protein